MTLSAFAEHRAYLHADTGETLLLRLPVPVGHGLQLGDDVAVTSTFLGALAGRLEHGAPGLSVPLGGIAKLHFGAFGGSIPGLVQASAFEGESVSVTDSWLGHAGRTPRRATWAATSHFLRSAPALSPGPRCRPRGRVRQLADQRGGREGAVQALAVQRARGGRSGDGQRGACAPVAAKPRPSACPWTRRPLW